NNTAVNESHETELHLIPSSHVLSADASFVDLLTVLSRTLEVNSNQSSHRDSISSIFSSLCIIDASYHPPRIITSIIQSHPDSSGPKSRTLHSMGWFPSGTVVVLSSCADRDASAMHGETEKQQREEKLLNKFVEWQSRNVLRHEEFGYNLPSSADKDRGVQTTTNLVLYSGLGINHSSSKDSNKLKPTDIFNAVQQRFQQDSQSNIQRDGKLLGNQKRKQQRTEQQRHERLDTILNNLQRSQHKTSAKVRNMLVKSRSVGDKKLRMEDRFHLEILFLDDTGDDAKEDTTAGKVASGVARSLGEDRAAEFLVSLEKSSQGEKKTNINSLSGKKYRRLPNTMPLHDAQLAGWLNEFDLVMIRIYLLHNDSRRINAMVGPSKSVLDAESDDESISDDENDDTIEVKGFEKQNNIPELMERASSISQAKYAALTSFEEPSKQSEQYNLQQRIRSVFQSIEAAGLDDKVNDNNKAVKKKNPVSKQVQNMLIKSKATGNVRIKQEDRVYLRVIIFHDGNKEVQSCGISSSYKFFDKRNDVGHVITTSGATTSLVGKDEYIEKEFIAQLPHTSNDSSKEETMFRKLTPSLTLGDAMQKKLLENFDSVLLRMFDKQAGMVSCEEWIGHDKC
ncbi:hypothetical protein ACHAWX_001085, partial [Stephanocyclus meneghinianus]